MVTQSTGWLATSFLFVVLLHACSDEPPGSTLRSIDGGRVDDQQSESPAEADQDAAPRADEPSPSTVSEVACCPPSPQPNCCMDYGGAKVGGSCGSVCDGMPSPSDPAWRLVKDKHGCPQWSSEGSTGPCCGGKPVPDGGVRAFSCYGDHGEPPRALDARAAAAQVASSVNGCTSDADCCVVYDACRAQGLVVAIAGRDSVRQLLDDAPNDKCLACLAPRVQVACVADVCVGANVSSDAGVVAGLERDHCGTIGKPSTRGWQQTPLGCGPSAP